MVGSSVHGFSLPVANHREVSQIIQILSDWDRSQQRSTTLLAVEPRCPTSAPSGRRSRTLRIVSGVRPQFPALAYLPALTPASRIWGSWKRLPTDSHTRRWAPANRNSLASLPVRSPPAGDRLQKKNVPLSFGPPQRVFAGFQFGSGLGTCGRGQRKNDCTRRRSWSGTCCRDTPEEVTRVRAACSVPRTEEREGASEAEERCAW